MHILFICTGNICRSPTAERLAVAYGARHGIPDLRASSAGTHAMVGHPIHPDAVPVLEKLGGEASKFVARRLTARIASDADLILTMTKSQRDRVLELTPHRLRRIFTISEAARIASELPARTPSDLANLRSHLPVSEVVDIPDPIGRGAEVYASVGSQIAELLPPILDLCRRDASD